MRNVCVGKIQSPAKRKVCVDNIGTGVIKIGSPNRDWNTSCRPPLDPAGFPHPADMTTPHHRACSHTDPPPTYTHVIRLTSVHPDCHLSGKNAAGACGASPFHLLPALLLHLYCDIIENSNLQAGQRYLLAIRRYLVLRAPDGVAWLRTAARSCARWAGCTGSKSSFYARPYFLESREPQQYHHSSSRIQHVESFWNISDGIILGILNIISCVNCHV